MAGFVLVPFGLFGRTAFLAEKVLGNVVSSGVKILVLAVIIGIGSTIFGQFTGGFNNPPTINDALTLILAALAMLGLSIFGPGIANGLIAGGPQLGAGAAVGTGLAVAGIGAAGAGLAAGRARRRWRRDRRDGARGRERRRRRHRGLSRGWAGRRRGSRRRGRLEPAASRRVQPARQLCGRRERCDGRRRAPPQRLRRPTASAPPAWAPRMKRNQTISRGVSVADHAIRSGDRPSGGASVDLSEGE